MRGKIEEKKTPIKRSLRYRNSESIFFRSERWPPTSVGTGPTKSQIVRTPLRVFYDCVRNPDWIVFSRFESIYGRAKIFK